MYKITVAGIGYVGLSIAVLLSLNNKVTAIDIVQDKVDALQNRKSLIADKMIEEYLLIKDLNLVATTNSFLAYKDADFVVITTPTDYDSDTGSFDTSSVESVITTVLSVNPETIIIIKSTVPFGYTEKVNKMFNTDNIIFSPEFIREGKALYDNLYPSRIIMGEQSERAMKFANLMLAGAINKDIPVVYTNSAEAEAIKLFSNTYLAMRVAFFNEMDTFAEIKGINVKDIIEGVCLDSRIGKYYNNPSFGYGGYCLPKDTKQLLNEYEDIPNNLIRAVIDSNSTRKNHITEMILKSDPKIVGIYRLTMKSNSDNFREASIFGIIRRLREKNVRIVIYEPYLDEDYLSDMKVIKEVNEFNRVCDVIVANRLSEEIMQFKNKIYTRDICGDD